MSPEAVIDSARVNPQNAILKFQSRNRKGVALPLQLPVPEGCLIRSSNHTTCKLTFFLLWFATWCCAQQIVVLKSGTTANLRGLHALSRGVVWASGTHGTYLRSLDSGKTWLVGSVPGAGGLDFRDVEAFDADTAFLLSAGPAGQSRIYKTTDSGKTWRLQFTNHDPKGFLDCMAFWDRAHGIALGDPVDGKFQLIATEDGGNNWTSIRATIPAAIDGEGAFAASGTCIDVQGKTNAWFVTGGKTARVFRSTDRGSTWRAVEAPLMHADSAGGFSIAFRDARHGVIVGGDYKNPERGEANIALTDDGGATWKLAGLSPESYFSAAIWSGTSLLVAGSSHAGLLQRDQDRTWTKYWDVNLNSLSTSEAEEAFGVGPNGTIVRFKVSGKPSATK
jgi:photosystem II stability/assembly factor-like uncharacterized protein